MKAAAIFRGPDIVWAVPGDTVLEGPAGRLAKAVPALCPAPLPTVFSEHGLLCARGLLLGAS